MTCSGRPVVWVHALSEGDHDLGFPSYLQEHIERHFALVTYADVQANPDLAASVAGVITINPRHKLCEEQLPMMSNLKVQWFKGVGWGGHTSSNIWSRCYAREKKGPDCV